MPEQIMKSLLLLASGLTFTSPSPVATTPIMTVSYKPDCKVSAEVNWKCAARVDVYVPVGVPVHIHRLKAGETTP